MSVLRVENLGKSFREYRSEWHRFARWFGFSVQPLSENWVIRNVNFEIGSGETVGIIGQNGAGKSTLLKMVTGTLHPTEGAVRINGRISAILELGMGFNPELSGRENAIHAAGLMGFDGNDIVEKLPEIEEFAEIGHYFDEPIRAYSSGMQMRVAFAVATAWRPDILIVDEALSVGDAYFVHKCFRRIREFQQEGTSLLIVSHDRSAIMGLCNRALLLEQGAVTKDGKPEEVFDYYNAIIAEKEHSTVQVTQLDCGKVQTSSGTGEATLEDIVLINGRGQSCNHVEVGETIELRLQIKVNQAVEHLVLGYSIRDRLGNIVYGTNTFFTDQVIAGPAAGNRYKFIVSFPGHLGVGSYSVQTALVDSDSHLSSNYEWRDVALMFDVVNSGNKQFIGSLWLEPTISLEEA